VLLLNTLCVLRAKGLLRLLGLDERQQHYKHMQPHGEMDPEAGESSPAGLERNTEAAAISPQGKEDIMSPLKSSNSFRWDFSQGNRTISMGANSNRGSFGEASAGVGLGLGLGLGQDYSQSSSLGSRFAALSCWRKMVFLLKRTHYSPLIALFVLACAWGEWLVWVTSKAQHGGEGREQKAESRA
jgi:hypothetical protein